MRTILACQRNAKPETMEMELHLLSLYDKIEEITTSAAIHLMEGGSQVKIAM